MNLDAESALLRQRAADEWNAAFDPGSDRVKLWLEDYLADTPDRAKAIVLAAVRWALTPGLNTAGIVNAVADLGSEYVEQRQFDHAEAARILDHDDERYTEDV